MINAERGDDALLQLRARDLWQAGGGPRVLGTGGYGQTWKISKI